MRSRLLVHVLAAAALIVVAPSAAQAQFDRLVKKAAEKIGNPEGKAEQSAAAPGTTASSKGAVANHISAEQLDAFIAAVGPAAQQAQRRVAWRKQKDAYEGKYEEYARCRQQALAASATAPVEVDEREMDRINALNESLGARMAATTDLATQRMLSDSVVIVLEMMQDAMYPAVKRCGARPAAYGAEPDGIDAAGVASRAKQHGFTAGQFGQLRERIGVWLTARETRGLSPESVSALQSREAQLQALAAYFEDVQWGTWSDLSNW